MRVVLVRGCCDVNSCPTEIHRTSNRDRERFGQNGGDRSGKSYWSPKPYGNRGLCGWMRSSMTRGFCTKYSRPCTAWRREWNKGGMVREKMKQFITAIENGIPREADVQSGDTQGLSNAEQANSEASKNWQLTDNLSKPRPWAAWMMLTILMFMKWQQEKCHRTMCPASTTNDDVTNKERRFRP